MGIPITPDRKEAETASSADAAPASASESKETPIIPREGSETPAGHPAAEPHGATPAREHIDTEGSRKETLKTVAIMIVAATILGIAFAVSLGWELPGLSEEKARAKKPDAGAPLKVELVKDEKNPKKFVPSTLMVPDEVRESLNIRKNKVDVGVAIATLPVTNQTLEFPGSTAFNPAKIARIRVRFPTNGSEVTSVGKLPSSKSTFPEEIPSRELRPGDTVEKGQNLADFYSVDVGTKKNDLIDAIYQLKLDQDIYERAVASGGAVPEVFVKNAYRAVVGDENNINRIEKTLETWNVPREDIAAVRKEAEEMSKQLIAKPGTRPPTDPDKEKQWGKVSLKSPISGVIIERNITANEIVVDNTVNIFQIANVDDLLVLVNVPEDQLPRLRELKAKGMLNWTIQTAGAPVKFKFTKETIDRLGGSGLPAPVVNKLRALTNREFVARPPLEEELGKVLTKEERQDWQKDIVNAVKVGLVGPVDEIGYLIDQNTHTAVLKGFIKNENGALRAGQYVTATIDLPREENVVEIPMAAIADDGRQTVVFVQPDPAKAQYTMRRVKVTHRFDKVAFVSSVLTEADVALGEAQVKDGLLPFSPLKEGDRVLTAGILELKKELEDRESAIADAQKP